MERTLTGANPADRAGLASLTGDLLTRGTTSRGATEIAREIESLGASIGAGAGPDSSAVSLQTRSDRVEEAFTVFADVAQHPAFAQEELERARQQALDALQVALSDPGDIANLLAPTRYDRVVEALGGYGEHVTEAKDIRPALERARASGKPSCVNVMIDPNVYSSGTMNQTMYK